MENGSRHELTRDLRRLGTTGATLAVLVLGFPGSAAAATDPVVSGDCPATVRGGDGSPLTIDAGALLGASGELEVGLGSRSEATLSVPLADAVSELGLDDLGVASDTAEELCEAGQGTVNAVTDPVQQALPGNQPENPDSNDPRPGDSGGDPTNSPDRTSRPTPTPTPEHDTPPDDVAGAGGRTEAPQGAGALLLADGWNGATEWTVPDAAGPELAVPPAAAVPPDGEQDRPAEHASAAERTDALDRLPLLLAVAALAFVGTTLAQTWISRQRSPE